MASEKNTPEHVENTPVLTSLKKTLKLIPVARRKRMTFVCVMCQCRFKSHVSLREHFKQHGKNQIDMRGRPMDQSTLLKSPKKNVSTLNLIECEYCHEVLPNISKAIEHKYRKHRDKGTNHFCEICGKLFPLKIALIQHKETNHVEIKLENLSTPNTTPELQNSIRQETFNCEFCPVKFQSIDAKEFHESSVHKFPLKLLLPMYVPPPSRKIKMNTCSEVFSVYYCPLCGSEYIMKYNLSKHLKDYHSSDELTKMPADSVIRCKTCEAIFHTKKGYDNHLVFHQDGDLYVTSEEQRRKIVARVDQDFDARRIPSKMEAIIMEMSNGNNRRRTIKCAETITTTTRGENPDESDNEPLSPPCTPSDSSDENEM